MMHNPFNKVLLSTNQVFCYLVNHDTQVVELHLFEYRVAGRNEKQLLQIMADQILGNKDTDINFADDKFAGICIGGNNPMKIIQDVYSQIQEDKGNEILNSEARYILKLSYEERYSVEHNLEFFVENEEGDIRI